MTTVLSLIVAIVAVFFGPLVAWAVTRQQIAVTAREVWMREFRVNLAAFLSSSAAYRQHMLHHTTDDPVKEKRLAEINDVLAPRYHSLRLLLAERGTQFAGFAQALEVFLQPRPEELSLRLHKLNTAAEGILQSERTAITADPGIWSALRSSIGLRTVPPGDHV